MARHLSPWYDQVILVSGALLTAVNWSQHWYAICVQYQSSSVPKLARKCGIKHWFRCGADGRAARGRAVYGHVITKFSGMGRFTYPWCSASVLHAPELRYQHRLDHASKSPANCNQRGWPETAEKHFWYSRQKNVLRKLPRIPYRRLKAGFSVCWLSFKLFVAGVLSEVHRCES